ncbi:hypothetical protein BaRGS_00038722 [Batillaria attramentaria]|uniref:Uncharacterized protein n=1 Tax=Batillaria attramentaria TaxID=370345 RepID=A0ABD0J5V8_9CAEN
MSTCIPDGDFINTKCIVGDMCWPCETNKTYDVIKTDRATNTRHCLSRTWSGQTEYSRYRLLQFDFLSLFVSPCLTVLHAQPRSAQADNEVLLALPAVVKGGTVRCTVCQPGWGTCCYHHSRGTGRRRSGRDADGGGKGVLLAEAATLTPTLRCNTLHGQCTSSSKSNYPPHLPPSLSCLQFDYTHDTVHYYTMAEATTTVTHDTAATTETRGRYLPHYKQQAPLSNGRRGRRLREKEKLKERNAERMKRAT